MGALPPVAPPWITEDDLLLKDALEAGASLEALAKGAIWFSRRYTIQELQCRWHDLLYDPDTSERASARMVELELSSQSNRSDDYKENGVSGKRKDETVRSHYYAMRKRIRSEPFSIVDLGFLDGPTLCSCQEQVKSHKNHPVENCNFGGSIVDHFHENNFGNVNHAFLQVMRANTADGGIADADTHAFHDKHQHSLEDEISDRIIGGNCLHEFREIVPHVSVNNDVESNMLGFFKQDNMDRNSNVLDGKLPVFEINSGVGDMGPPQELPVGIIFEPAKSLGTNPVSICTGFGQCTGFSSPILDCAATDIHLEYSSPGPTVPIWRTMEDISTPSALNNETLDDRNKGDGEAMVCPGTDDKHVSWGYNVLLSDPYLEDRTSEDGLKSSGVITDGDFSELESSLFNFTNSVLFMDDEDGKEMMDRSCLDGLSSIPLNSFGDVQQDDIPNAAEHSLARELSLMIPNAACPGELGAFNDKLHYGYKVCKQNTSDPSSMFELNPDSPERRNGVICCTLNTEDPDIPCNDDAFLPPQVLLPIVAPGIHHNSEVGISSPLSSMDFCCSEIETEHGLNHAKEEEFDASGLTEPQFLLAISPSNQITSAVTSELPGGVHLDTDSRHIITDPTHIISVEGEPRECGSAHLTPFSMSAGEVPEVNEKVELDKFSKFDGSMDFVLENGNHCTYQNDNDPQKLFFDHKQEPDVSGAQQNHLSKEHGSFEMPFPEPIANPSTSDQEVQPLEDENDVPHICDIEALILGMDLEPCDQDSYTEVSRYQHEDAKRAILRLEQSAYSYMQRAILSHRAFAIFYGRFLKHYIRKREVSIGRATDDTNVDIDLAKEGRVNRISRRQAIIKMEDNGSFSLMNLGKGLIVVNGKEVARGHCTKLGSGCLIEIRSMSFIFEANQKAVNRYLADIARKNQDTAIKFEWSAEGMS